MKIIFISHSYPPILGGIENQNFNLATGLGKLDQVKIKIISNKKGKWLLPLFLPWAFLKTFFILSNYDACLFGSGVVAPIGRVLRFFHPRKKFFSIAHGLDITFANKKGLLSQIYKVINIPAIGSMNKIIAVGNSTIEEAVKLGISRKKCVFIPNGMDLEKLQSNGTRQDAEKIFGKKLAGKKLILRLGRFVPHKGTSWFINNVMPHLGENIILVAAGGRVAKNTAGDKDDFPACEKAIFENNLQNRVRLLVGISNEERNVLLNNADLVVAPNIKIDGSIEGFGLNTIEAAACERVVIASDLEGLADAIKNGKNGFLVESENINQWVNKINKIIGSGEAFIRFFGKKAAQYTKENYSWKKICQRYLAEMKK